MADDKTDPTAPAGNKPVISGEVIKTGKAPYHFKQGANKSFYITIKNEDSDKTLWGSSIEKAAERAGVKLNDKVELSASKQGGFEFKKNSQPVKHIDSSIEASPGAKNPSIKRLDTPHIPDKILKDYDIMKRDGFMQDRSVFYRKNQPDIPAFEDKGRSLSTVRNDRDTVEAMVQLSQSKGWDQLTVKGSDAFKRNVWLEATARGIDVKGYQPSHYDLQALEFRKDELGHNQIQGKNLNRNQNMQQNPAAPDKAQDKPTDLSAEKNIAREEVKRASIDATPASASKARSDLEAGISAASAKVAGIRGDASREKTEDLVKPGQPSKTPEKTNTTTAVYDRVFKDSIKNLKPQDQARLTGIWEQKKSDIAKNPSLVAEPLKKQHPKFQEIQSPSKDPQQSQTRSK